VRDVGQSSAVEGKSPLARRLIFGEYRNCQFRDLPGFAGQPARLSRRVLLFLGLGVSLKATRRDSPNSLNLAVNFPAVNCPAVFWGILRPVTGPLPVNAAEIGFLTADFGVARLSTGRISG
jgi:hypothetical protein